jgi:hypothetical protein
MGTCLVGEAETRTMRATQGGHLEGVDVLVRAATPMARDTHHEVLGRHFGVQAERGPRAHVREGDEQRPVRP